MKLDRLFVFCTFTVILVAATGLHAQKTPTAVGNWLYRFSDREGVPSKCDCDYFEEQVQINADGTFQYQSQRGRMRPEIIYEKGTWEMRNDSVVTLVTTHTKGDLFPLDMDNTRIDKWRRYYNHHDFQIESYNRSMQEWGGGKEYERISW